MLRTVAVFSEPTVAHLARNNLAAEGITSYLSNERVVANDWALGQAVGHIQLQVHSDDYELASLTLSTKSEISEGDLAELAMEASPEEPASPVFGMFYPDGTVDDEKLNETRDLDKDRDEQRDLEEELNPREILVDRAFRAAILGLCIPFLPPFLTWLLIDIACQDAPLRPRYKKKLAWSVVLHIPAFVLFLVLLRILFRT